MTTRNPARSAMSSSSTPSRRVFAVTDVNVRSSKRWRSYDSARHIGEVNARDSERSPAVERSQRDRDEVADRSEENRRVERLGWQIRGTARRRGAEVERESLRIR